MFSGSGICLPYEKGSGAATCTVASNPLGGLRSITCPAALDAASLLGGLRVATRPVLPREPWASSIKNSLVDLLVQLDLHVFNVHAHISKAPDGRAIMDLQHVPTGNAVNVCKTCGQAVIVCSVAPALWTTRLTPL
jgi:hypothetical protein